MCSDSLSHVKRGSIRITEVLPHQHPLSWWNSCSRSQSFSSSLAVQSCAAPHRGRVQLQDTCSLLQLLCTIPETSQERLVPYLSPFMCLDYSVFWTSILPLSKNTWMKGRRIRWEPQNWVEFCRKIILEDPFHISVKELLIICLNKVNVSWLLAFFLK